MKPKRTYPESQNNLKTVLCIIAAAAIILISFPSFAADEAGADAVTDTQPVIAEEDITEVTDEDEEESGTEVIQAGYVTMSAVSGNTSITN